MKIRIILKQITYHINKQILYKLDIYAEKGTYACLSHGRLSEGELLSFEGEEKQRLRIGVLI